MISSFVFIDVPTMVVTALPAVESTFLTAMCRLSVIVNVRTLRGIVETESSLRQFHILGFRSFNLTP